MADPDCLFFRIVAGQLPCDRVYEDDESDFAAEIFDIVLLRVLVPGETEPVLELTPFRPAHLRGRGGGPGGRGGGEQRLHAGPLTAGLLPAMGKCGRRGARIRREVRGGT